MIHQRHFVTPGAGGAASPGGGVSLSASRDSLSGREGTPQQATPPSGNSKSASRESLSLRREKSSLSSSGGGGGGGDAASRPSRIAASASKASSTVSRIKRQRSSLMPTSEKGEKEAVNVKREVTASPAAAGGGGDGPSVAPSVEPVLDASLSPAGATSPLNMSDAVSASLEVLQLRQENDALKNDVQVGCEGFFFLWLPM